jgi:uncharacterized protein YndB with AHSA1/START domain
MHLIEKTVIIAAPPADVWNAPTVCHRPRYHAEPATVIT